MTPLQLAREWCANYQADGSCLGADLAHTGQISRCKPLPRCALSKVGGICAYFEQCVLPQGPRLTHSDPAHTGSREQFDRAARAYWRRTRSAAAARPCPDCKERELEPRRRVCFACALKRRRATLSAANRKRQISITTVKPV